VLLFIDRQLDWFIGDLYIAGSDTTSRTIVWAMAALVARPDIYSKIQNEVDDVIGTSRRPRMSDRRNMPLTGNVRLLTGNVRSLTGNVRSLTGNVRSCLASHHSTNVNASLNNFEWILNLLIYQEVLKHVTWNLSSSFPGSQWYCRYGQIWEKST
jgi:hypothetical protein